MSKGFEIYTLFSGSSGNSVYINCDGESVLIDIGMSAKAASDALLNIGSSAEEISAVFVTHEHSDHIKGIPVFTKKGDIPVHVARASYEASPLSADGKGRYVIHEPVFSEEIGNMRISSFVTPHDSEMSLGYIIETPYGTAGVATDMGYMTKGVYERIRECKYLILESNYDEGMLINGPYPRYLKKRIFSNRGHMSNDACAETVWHLASEKTEKIMLAHLSLENNSPSLALDCSARALDEKGLSGRTELKVAQRLVPTKFI
ncbi:MAG: MBL fold metallo-hydrolase [Ruminococcaceae bacterium]|nr:MBL fold metallo-hydrolase [Oscillospiraceae bacterium]